MTHLTELPNEPVTELKWYENRALVTVLSGLSYLIPPVALFLVWTSKQVTLSVKLLVTAAIIVGAVWFYLEAVR